MKKVLNPIATVASASNEPYYTQKQQQAMSMLFVFHYVSI